MIVKIWPVRGSKGVKNSLLYVQDDNKVVKIEKDDEGHITRRTVMDTADEFKIDADQYFIENETDIARVMEYVGNEDKIKSKFISGYMCSPDYAEDDFLSSRNVTCQHAGKQVKDGAEDIVAFHIVQSFPEDLEISDEEVHQCGIELVERLGQHQAVIASHVHPVVDEEGEVHGRCKHNHIIINAYIHPEKIDPERPAVIKYDSSQKDYSMLRFWNDEIAIEHGLPIIRNPDMERKFSWYEAEMSKQNTSWKGRVKLDIEEARRVTGNWDEFVTFMKHNGYKIQDRGTNITYIAPDLEHKVRGKTLGRPYSKEGLETYWSIRDQAEKEVQEIVKLNRNIRIGELVKVKKDLTVAIPIGNEGVEDVRYHHISLDRKDISAQAISTYFRKKDHYDVFDSNENMVAAFSGAELIEYFNMLRDGLKEAEKEENAAKDPDAWKNTDEYYYNDAFRNSQTKEHYRVPKRKKNGDEIPLLRLIFILACVILKKEHELWKPRTIPKDKANEPIYGRVDWKIQNMMDALAVAREENLNTPEEVDEKLQIVGADYSRIRSALHRTQATKDNMDTLASAVRQFQETSSIAEAVLAMPAGEDRALAEQEHAAELTMYKNAKAAMYKRGLSSSEKISEFQARYENTLENLERLQNKCEDAKEAYRRLKKLQYNVKLAQNAQYVYGPTYISGQRHNAFEEQKPRAKGYQDERKNANF